jgi:hypothetical protein|tara:strand:+ start:241 stop:945 length:705 start_codon:yes stop_codon:yes gene_type:complete
VANYEVSTTNFDVTQNVANDYSIGLNYEAPSKGVQYQNLILDSLTSLFDGSRTVFPLTVSGDAYEALNDQQLIISMDNVILEPGVGYTVSGDQITFATPPASSSVPFFGVALANTADLTRTINYVVDNGSRPMTIGNKGYLTIDVTGNIQSFVLLADNIGTLELDIRKCNFDDFPAGTSICGNSRPELNNEVKKSDITLTGWTKQLNAGDILQYEVINVSTTLKKFAIALKVNL